MATPVDTNTTDARALATASVDRTRNETTSDQDGTLVHIGGGLYLSAGHVFFQFVNPDAPRSADDYRLMTGEGLVAPLTHTIAGPDFSDTFTNHGWGTEGGSDISSVLSADATDVSIPMIIYADPNEASGTLATYGFPVDGGFDGSTMVEVSGTLATNSHLTVPTGNGDMTVLTSNIGMQVYSGQSGSGMWLTNDMDGDGVQETYLAGIVSLDIQYVGGLHSTGFEPLGDIYTELGATIDAAGLNADDFARATLVSGQTLGSAHTSVEGTSLNEDIIGGVNADTLDGNGGDDDLAGGAGDDVLVGGHGFDTLDGGDGADSLDGGIGTDFLYGGDGDDTLTAGQGRDVLDGGAGNDVFIDGLGLDRMTGGAGADTFRMSADSKHDIIVDFEDGADIIDVSEWSVFSFVELTISDHRPGRVVISFGDETIVVADTNRTLEAADFSADDFVFTDPNAPLPVVTGTSGDDRLIGTIAAEEIHDGAGRDTMFGRGGGDQFVLAADGEVDSIKDYQDNSDKIDVSAWGATNFADLSLVERRPGQILVSHEDETVWVSDSARALLVSDLTADDFIFV
ncbi:MAG: calcium-binding protein [Pseudomonadota bacterium]